MLHLKTYGGTKEDLRAYSIFVAWETYASEDLARNPM